MSGRVATINVLTVVSMTFPLSRYGYVLPKSELCPTQKRPAAPAKNKLPSRAAALLAAIEYASKPRWRVGAARRYPTATLKIGRPVHTRKAAGQRPPKSIASRAFAIVAALR